MKRKSLIAVIVLSCIVGAILLTTGICAIIANSRNDNSSPNELLSSWQGMIEDNALLKKIAITGAHDAGTKGLPYFAATQDRDIKSLLECGTRYFDLRVSYASGELKIYHGPSKGVKLDKVLQDVREFITANATENLILDFQHFEEQNVEAQSGAINLVEEKLADLLVTNSTEKSDVDFVDELTLGDVRGKCLVVWGRENDEILKKPYVFKRNNDDGTRQNSVIHSYYQGSLNKKSSSAYTSFALQKYIEEYQKVNCGLFVLQGQLTDGLLVFGPHFREATHTDKMNEYVKNLAASENLSIINIVMRDFVTPAKNCYTLNLNIAKGLVKPTCIDDYTTMINTHIAIL